MQGGIRTAIAGSGGGSGGGDISGILWDGSENAIIPYVGKGGSNLSFSPEDSINWLIDGTGAAVDPEPMNALSVRKGNLAVMGTSQYDDGGGTGKVIDQYAGSKFGLTGDNSGGVIWAERQIGIGVDRYNGTYASLDINEVDTLPGIYIGQKAIAPGARKASNSIIMGIPF